MSTDVPFLARQLRRHASHYYGDYIRVLFVIGAILIFFLYFTPGDKVFSVSVSLAMILALVIAAGLLNVVQAWTQWVAVLLCGLELVLFSELSFLRFKNFVSVELLQNLIIASLAIIFVIALYLSVRTLRGTLMRGAPVIR